MKKHKITLSLSKDVMEVLESNVPKGERSAFIEGAIRSKFNMNEQNKFLDDLTSGKSPHGHLLANFDAAKEMAESINDDEFLSDSELNELDDIF